MKVGFRCCCDLSGGQDVHLETRTELEAVDDASCLVVGPVVDSLSNTCYKPFVVLLSCFVLLFNALIKQCEYGPMSVGLSDLENTNKTKHYRHLCTC